MNAVKSAGIAKFRNAGQVCISPTRFLVHNKIKGDFLAAFTEVANKLKVGDGMMDGTTMGSLANPRRLAAMQAITEDAIKKGAKLVTGGERVGSTGNFFAPTILTDLSPDADILNNEPFGPMAAVRGFDDLEDALKEANRLPFGLAGYAYTRSIKNVQMLTQRLEVGMLWINQPGLAWPEMPFGGMKDSGYGSEGGSEAIEAYLNTKAVSIVCI
jgi:succinate-semialdehyde dehydrogenase/glutarate-semialdehyde dehydrogenase